jgi:hypothetical protein
MTDFKGRWNAFLGRAPRPRCTCCNSSFEELYRAGQADEIAQLRAERDAAVARAEALSTLLRGMAARSTYFRRRYREAREHACLAYSHGGLTHLERDPAAAYALAERLAAHPAND